MKGSNPAVYGFNRRELIANQRDQLIADTREGILVLENQQLKENWETFENSWNDFLITSAENQRDLATMLTDKLTHLQTSNDMLSRSLDQHADQFTRKLKSSADAAVIAIENAAAEARHSIAAVSDSARTAMHMANKRARWSLIMLFLCPATLMAGMILHYLGLI